MTSTVLDHPLDGQGCAMVIQGRRREYYPHRIVSHVRVKMDIRGRPSVAAFYLGDPEFFDFGD